jgi:hypothetical protein
MPSSRPRARRDSSVDEFVFSPQFLQELAEWEQRASVKDKETLDEALAAIVKNPALAGRAPSFYDPLAPSYLYRVGAVLVHYRIVKDQVEFLNLFYPRG